MAKECREQDERGHQGRQEGGDQRVLRGVRQPPTAEVSCGGARDEGVRGEAEGDDERSATQLGHGSLAR